jgi:hypothetical protein
VHILYSLIGNEYQNSIKDIGLNILILVALALDSVSDFIYQRIHSNLKGCVQKPSDFESICTFSEQIYSLFAELWNLYVMRFGILIALNMKSAVSRDVTLCGLLNDNQQLRGTCCVHLQDTAVLV